MMNYDDMVSRQLVAELEKRNLSTEGRKPELVQRLLDDDREKANAEQPDSEQLADLAPGGVEAESAEDVSQPDASAVPSEPREWERCSVHGGPLSECPEGSHPGLPRVDKEGS